MHHLDSDPKAPQWRIGNARRRRIPRSLSSGIHMCLKHDHMMHPRHLLGMALKLKPAFSSGVSACSVQHRRSPRWWVRCTKVLKARAYPAGGPCGLPSASPAAACSHLLGTLQLATPWHSNAEGISSCLPKEKPVSIPFRFLESTSPPQMHFPEFQT